MCTALLSIEPGRPTLLVGVRDEMTSRAWQPPARHWPERAGELIGGRDLQAGGTWLAVSPQDRRAACVLNGRGKAAPEVTRRSRGVLPLDAAAGMPLDPQVLADFDPFILVTAEPKRAIAQSWDGDALTEREFAPGLHFAVNSGWASDLLPDLLQPTDSLNPGQNEAANPSRPEPTSPSQPTSASQPEPTHPSQPASPSQANGRAHELARVAYFLPRFAVAARPDPKPGQPVAEAWGEWFPLLNGDGLATDDDRALIVRRDFGDGRVWGSTSISLIAVSVDGLRYDFTSAPGDPAAWVTEL
jgi:hypothetical protein